MSELGARRFEYAADGSDLSEQVCETVLAPVANGLCGTDFRHGPARQVDQERSLSFVDDTTIILGFSAMKTNYVIEEDRFAVLYNASLTFMRPRVPTELWPGTQDIQDVNPDISDDQARSGLRLVSERGYSFENATDAEEDIDEDDDIEDDYVRETWEYIIDDVDFEPRRDVSYEYYQDCEHIYTVSINGNPRQMLMLSEDVEEDIVLSDKDASLFTTYSDLDIEMIKAIVAFDFTRVRQMLDSLGIHYPMPDPYQELICEDVEDEPGGDD